MSAPPKSSRTRTPEPAALNASLLPQLQVFLAVARLHSFSGAARELGVSASAVSHAVRQLEKQLRLVLLARTTRSVSLTDIGKRLMEGTAPALGQVMETITQITAPSGELTGRLKLSVPRPAMSYVEPALLTFRARHPRVEIEVVTEERFVNIVAEGYDAGVRLSEAIERDMVQVRLTGPFRFVVVGSPAYFAKHGVPQQPRDLLKHECFTHRASTTGALWAWEFERGRKSWNVPVRGGVISNDFAFWVALAEAGEGLIYTAEHLVAAQLRAGKLKAVLEPYSPTVPGLFLYFQSRAQRTPVLQAFVEITRERVVPEP